MPSHYLNLNQCWHIVSWTLGNKLQCNINGNSNIFIQENGLENVVCKKAAILSLPQCVTLHNFCPAISDGLWLSSLLYHILVVGMTWVISFPAAHFMSNVSIVIQIWWKFLFSSHWSICEVIAMTFCTWHDSCAVGAVAKFHRDMMPYGGVTPKSIFNWIWITITKPNPM